MIRKTEPDSKIPQYGAASKYLGEEGELYFEQQNAGGVLASKYNEFIFRPYVSEKDDVLDFGCGGGHLLNVLNPWKKVGVEINPAARAQAAQLGVSVYSSLDEVRGQTFSRIITSHALEHVPNPYQALVQLRQMLRPDGLLLWLAPMDDWHAKHQKRWNPDDDDLHLYTWTPLLMGNLLRVAGYRPESVSILVHACPPAIISERLWNISPSLFHFAARFWAMARKQRQIFAVVAPD
jgi:SAM-dependent methyltransferase